jgi:hypothetical protein
MSSSLIFIVIRVKGGKKIKKPSHGRNIFRYKNKPISFEQIPTQLTHDGFADHATQ